MGVVDSRVIRSVGGGRAAAARVLPGLPEPAPARIVPRETASSPCSSWSCSWCRSSLHQASVLPRLASLALLGGMAPWLRLPVHSHRGTKSAPLFLYTDSAPSEGVNGLRRIRVHLKCWARLARSPTSGSYRLVFSLLLPATKEAEASSAGGCWLPPPVAQATSGQAVATGGTTGEQRIGGRSARSAEDGRGVLGTASADAHSGDE